jgi:hypothetical protein
MKRYKVRITDNNCFHKEYPDGTGFGGSYGEPIVVTMCLNEAEFKALTMFMGQVSELRHDIALFSFSQCIVLTPWHKRVLCENFRAITPEQVTIEFLFK